jgi:hypothetical protein
MSARGVQSTPPPRPRDSPADEDERPNNPASDPRCPSGGFTLCGARLVRRLQRLRARFGRDASAADDAALRFALAVARRRHREAARRRRRSGAALSHDASPALAPLARLRQGRASGSLAGTPAVPVVVGITALIQVRFTTFQLDADSNARTRPHPGRSRGTSALGLLHIRGRSGAAQAHAWPARQYRQRDAARRQRLLHLTGRTARRRPARGHCGSIDARSMPAGTFSWPMGGGGLVSGVTAFA